jgi:transposase-like protein
MDRKHYTAGQIIKHLREAEIFLGKGNTLAQVSKKIEVSEQTYYRWRREYGEEKDLRFLRSSQRGRGFGWMKALVYD